MAPPSGAREPGDARRSQDELGRAFREHVEAVYRYVHTRVHRVADAEDITSEVFARAVRWLDTARSPAEVRSWLLHTAASVIAAHWQTVYGDVRLAERLQWNPLAPVADRDDGAAVARAAAILSRLPSRYREVLRLRFLEGLSAPAIARRMGLRPGHVRVLQYRALRKAAALWRDGGAS